MAAEKKEQQKRSGYWTPAAILAAEAGEKDLYGQHRETL